MTSTDLVLTRTYAVSAEVLFDAWLTPAVLKQFMCPAPGTSVDEACSDATVGGTFEIVMRVGDQLMPHTGEYLAIEPHRLLRFTWCSPMAGDGSIVELEFEAQGAATALTLSHYKLPDQKAVEAHTGGWRHILETLKTVESTDG